MKSFTINVFVIALLFSPSIVQGQISTHHGLNASTQHHHGMDKVPLIHWKFYAGIGTSTYYGRVTSRFVSDPSYEFFSAIDIRPTLTLGVAYKFHDHVLARLEVSNYWIEGQMGDKRAKKEDGFKLNYGFRANNFDFSLLGQINILPYSYLIGQGNRIVPYVLVGIGFTTNTPQVQDNGKWVNLSSITNKISTPLVGVLPFGLGVMYRLSGNLDIGVEVSARYTLGGSIDGLTKQSISGSTLNSKEYAFFSQYYDQSTINQTSIFYDRSTPHDVYTLVQLKASYTFIPARFQHLFDQKDLNFSNKAKGQKTKRNFKR